MEPAELDLATLVTLNGPAVVRLVLTRLEARGHPGVKPSHGYVIQRLDEDEPTIGALATSLAMTQQGASKQVSDLERLGYVERVTDTSDQRIRYVRLTTAGRAMLEAAREIRATIDDRLVEQVGPEDVAAARRVLVAMLGLSDLPRQIGTRSVPMPPAR